MNVIVVRNDRTIVVQSKPGAATIRVVQTVSPVPVSGQTIDYIDGGNF